MGTADQPRCARACGGLLSGYTGADLEVCSLGHWPWVGGGSLKSGWNEQVDVFETSYTAACGEVGQLLPRSASTFRFTSTNTLGPGLGQLAPSPWALTPSGRAWAGRNRSLHWFPLS